MCLTILERYALKGKGLPFSYLLTMFKWEQTEQKESCPGMFILTMSY